MDSRCLLQLTVFAAAPIEACEICLLLFTPGLAIDTKPDTRDRFSPGLGNDSLAFLAMGQPLTVRQPTPCQLNGITNAGVYLILHSPVTGPPYGHNALLFTWFSMMSSLWA